MDKKEQILHYHRVDGLSLREISRRTGVNRKTVTRYVREYEAMVQSDSEEGIDMCLASKPKYPRRKAERSKLTEPVCAEIEYWLAENARRRQMGMRKQCLKRQDIHRALLEKGFDVSYSSVCKYIQERRAEKSGKPMPEWGELSEKDKEEVEEQMERLNAISIQENTVQPDHEENLDFLNRALDQWLKAQQQEAVRTNDRTKDIFCRRSAVVGFRAGMLAWFLYGEKNTATYRKHTVNFARWIATQMLNQHLLRFQIENTDSNTNRWEVAYKMLNEEFTREELQQALDATGTTTMLKQVVYRWKILGCIDPIEAATGPSGHKQAVRFRKVK